MVNIKANILLNSKLTQNLAVFFVFVIVYFVLDSLLIALSILGRLGIFRLISLLYTSNFLVLPSFWLIYSGFNLIRKKKLFANIIILCASAFLLSVFSYATYIEPRAIRIEESQIHTSKIKGKLVIAHISDIQTARVGNYEERIIQKLSELKPDIIFHTGDLAQVNGDYEYEMKITKLARLFSRLDPKYGIFNVMGNTDSCHDKSKMRIFDKESNAKTLINQSRSIIDDNISLNILGLTWRQSSAGDSDTITKWLSSNDGKFTIILGHAPDYVLGIMDKDIDLCLAGHTHGGQIRIPFLGPLLNFSDTPKSWASGFRKINNINLNVSAGLGTEHAGGLFPLRFNCPPTISIIKVIGRTSAETTNSLD